MYAYDLKQSAQEYCLRMAQLNHCAERIYISDKIKQQFAGTHEFTMIQSMDDLEKARTCSLTELAHYNLNDRFILLRENRAYIMNWIFRTPINLSSD